jgi:anti-sigma-K factor RskA
MVHEDYKEMIPARALSALDAGDGRALSEHLSECSECRQQLAEWEATAAALALVAQPLEPSPRVRDRILNAVRAEAQGAQSESTVSSTSSKVLPFKPAPANVWTTIGSLGAIAAAIVFLALIISLFVLWRENRAAQAQLVALSRQLNDVGRQLDQSKRIVQLFSQPGSTMKELAGTEVAPGATAKLAYDRTGHAMLLAQGLPAAPEGKEYQLWFIVGGKAPIPGRSFAPDVSGSGTLSDVVPAEAVNTAAVFAITLEPRGGVKAPTGKIFLRSGS